jgi:hypothetical protein
VPGTLARGSNFLTNAADNGSILPMIKKQTVLVLGAGASYPYGYPLGRQLVRDIVQNVANPNSPLHKDLDQLHLRIPMLHFQQFRDALEASASPSIDAFLESRNNFLLLGRHAIACQLLRCEKRENFYAKDDWYHYLYDRMRDPRRFENFGESKISFVTFNYDRSLEFFLFTALRNTFQKTPPECVENFKKLPIIHVHGFVSRSPTDEDNWRYGESTLPEAIKQSVEQIKIIHETTDDTDEFHRARLILSQAEKICFLGFGFHETNLMRLFKGVSTTRYPTPSAPDKQWSLSSGVKIYGHNFDFTDKEREHIEQFLPLPTCDWGDRKQTCEVFLREKGVLLD